MPARPGESEEDYRKRRDTERSSKPRETEEERAARKAREAAEGKSSRPKETEEERAARKAREAAEGKSSRPKETEEERAARKAREAADGKSSRPKETEEERAARKARETAEGKSSRPKETEEERAARKAAEAAKGSSSRPKETEEERAARKAREAMGDSKSARPKETEEERAARKAREAMGDSKSARPKETEEERAARKAKEREREKQKEDKKVVRVEANIGSIHKSSSEVVAPKAEPKVQARPVVQQADDDEDDDYGDDDFVDAAEAEALEKARKAMEAENERIRKAMAARRAGADDSKDAKNTSSKAGGSSATTDPEITGTSQISVSDLQRQKYRVQFEADLARATALKRLVDLESVSVTIADIAPMSEYDLYIRSFGGAERVQTAVQAPPENDIFDVEVQAERVVMKSKGSQAPEDLGLFPERQMIRGFGFGAQTDDEPTPAAAPVKKSKKDREKDKEKGSSTTDAETNTASSSTGASKSANTNTNNNNALSFDTASLSAFLTRVFPVVRTLLDENDAHKFHAHAKVKSEHAFSTSVTDLKTPIVEGRSVIDTQFSKASPQNVIALYGPQAQPAGALAKYPSVALMWNVNDPTTTDKVLVSTAPLTSVCCSPSRPHLVYGGTTSGSVCVWDLREPNYRHSTLPDGTTTRLPSFSTEWLADNHDYPVVQVVVAGYNSIIATRGKDEAETLTSIDSRGTCFFWLVNEDNHNKGGAAGGRSVAMSSPTSPTSDKGSPKASKGGVFNDTEHGQNLFSAVKLFKASSMNLLPSAQRNDSVSCCEFFPSDPTQLVAGSSEVLHLNRYGSITAPNKYTHYARWAQNSSTSPVTSLHFSPMDSRVLLSAYQDGSVRLFLKDSADPKLTIPLAPVGSITRVRCSPSLRWVTFALDSTGTFYTLDHAANDNKNAPKLKAMMGGMQNGRCMTFDVSNEERAEGRVIFGFENGTLQVHTVAPEKLRVEASSRNEHWL